MILDVTFASVDSFISNPIATIKRVRFGKGRSRLVGIQAANTHKVLINLSSARTIIDLDAAAVHYEFLFNPDL